VIELRVHLDDATLQQSIHTLLLAKEKAVKRAFLRAQNKTAKWYSSQVAKRISATYGIPQSKFKKMRIMVTTAMVSAHTKPAVVWVGYRDIAAHLLGKPKEEREYGGTFVKDYFFKGAFAAKNRRGEMVVFKRRTKKRLPIDVQKISIREGAIVAVQRLNRRAEERFKVLLDQEINYELSKLK